MPAKPRIVPCLWFDTQAEEAGREQHRKPPGSVMIVEFKLDGQKFTALNGGPDFKFNEAVSLQIFCKDQKEVDYYWGKLTAGGDPGAQVCGWLKDRFGLSWQVVPEAAVKLLSDHKSVKSQRAFAAMMQMKKIDVAAIKRAYDGK